VSVQAITWALESATNVPPQHVSLLIGLANHADRDGRGSYPSIATLARYTRKSPRQVQRGLAELVAAGVIRPGDQRLTMHMRADRRPAVWDLRMAGAGSQPRPSDPERGDADDTSRMSPRDQGGVTSTSPREKPRGDTGDANGVTPVTRRGDTGDTPPINRNEPSLNRPRNRTTSSSATPSAPADTAPRTKRKPTSAKTDPNAGRDDVEALCNRLADGMVANGCLRPTITKQWRDAARLLLDKDGRDLPKALGLIDWALNDEFWAPNIRSMPKFRKQYDVLRQRANAEWEARKSGTRSPSRTGRLWRSPTKPGAYDRQKARQRRIS
jgi:hypothetical protein